MDTMIEKVARCLAEADARKQNPITTKRDGSEWVGSLPLNEWVNRYWRFHIVEAKTVIAVVQAGA